MRIENKDPAAFRLAEQRSKGGKKWNEEGEIDGAQRVGGALVLNQRLARQACKFTPHGGHAGADGPDGAVRCGVSGELEAENPLKLAPRRCMDALE